MSDAIAAIEKKLGADALHHVKKNETLVLNAYGMNTTIGGAA